MTVPDERYRRGVEILQGATVQGAPSRNGWTFWHVEEAGALLPLDALRQRTWRAWRWPDRQM